MTSPIPPPPSHPSRPSAHDSASDAAPDSAASTLSRLATRLSAPSPSSSSGHATPSTESGLGTFLGAPALPDASAPAGDLRDGNFDADVDDDDGFEIEMDSLAPAGHRRRRSSLMSSGAHRAPSRTQSASSQSRVGDGSRIPEEGSEGDGTDGDLSDEDLHDDEETGLTRHDRRRKQRRKRHNTQLDNRIVSDRITAEEVKEADQNVVKKLLVNGTLILLWYLFSLSISLYNKWMFDKEKLNFRFPLFITSTHMLVQFSLSCLVLYFVPSLRPQRGYKSEVRRDAEPAPLMTKWFYLTRIGPCGAATGLDIGLGNTSLQFITLTFYTMCKSSALAFVLLFAFVFRLETPTWKLVAIIATMTVGVIMMVAGEVTFELAGFILVISAAFFSGFRWGLTQILLLRNPATSNPFSSIFYLAPIMFVTLLSIAIPVEGFGPLFAGLRLLADQWGPVKTPVLLLFPGTIAFLMTASEFALLQRTSVVTLSIAGIFKEVVTIATATLVFDDVLTPINLSGLLVTMAAIGTYNYIKISKMRADARADVHQTHLAAEEAVLGGQSASEAENDDPDAEDAGLLRRKSADFVTSDGDIIPRPEASPVRGEARGEHRSERED